MTSEQIAELLPAFEDVYNSRFLACSAITLAIYDWALVFCDELETIMKARWTVPKALYFYIRIVTPLGLLFCTYHLSSLRPSLTDSQNSCVAWLTLVLLGMVTSTAAANGLLALRLMALYRRKKAVVWFIRCFFVGSYGATLGIGLHSVVMSYNSLFYSEIIGVCATSRRPESFPAVFYGPAAFEFFVFALTAWRGIQDAKIIAGTGSAPFLLVLYRDGFICFFVMLAFRAWNIKIYMTQPLSSFSLGIELMWAINTILTTRVYLNLVWLVRRPVIETNPSNRMNMGTNIHMRVQTEVHTSSWRPRRHGSVRNTENIN